MKRNIYVIMTVFSVSMLMFVSTGCIARETYQAPIYRTETYQEPTYGTVYSGEMGEYHLLGGNDVYKIRDITSFSKVYTGEGKLGKEYTFHICRNSACSDYYKIQFWDLQPETKMTGYETRTRQVIDHYETRTR